MNTWQEPVLGRSDFSNPVAAGLRQRWLLIILFSFVILITAAIESRPLKKIPPGYGHPKPRSNVLALAMDFELSPAMRYSPGDDSHSFISLPYAAAVKLVYALLPYRLIALRAVSLVSMLLALFFLYRTAALLFSPTVGIICVAVLATTPAYFDKMISYGFISFSSMAVAAIGYVLALFLKENKYSRTALLSLLSFLTLSLYASARLAVIWVILLHLIYLKEYWRSLLLYLILLATLVAASDLAFEGPGYDLVKANKLFCPERTPLARSETRDIIGEFIYRIRSNALTASYYFSLRHKPFYNQRAEEWQKWNNIFTIVYFPFMLAGIAICLARLKKNNVYLLTCFLVFFLTIFISSDRLLERRIINSLPAAALFIALGIWGVFSWLRSRIGSRGYVGFSAVFLTVLLILPAGYNVYDFLCSFSRAPYGYSRPQLRRFVEVIREHGETVKEIRYNRRTEVLIWGNSYFDCELISRDIIRKLQVDNWDYARRLSRPVKLREQIEFARREGGNIFYVHTYPAAVPGQSPEDNLWPAEHIEEVERTMAGLIDIFQVPGMDEVYFMLVRPVR